MRVAGRPGARLLARTGLLYLRAQAVTGLGSSAGLFEPLLLLDALIDAALDAFAGKHGLAGGSLPFFFGGAALDRVGDDEGGDHQGG